MREGNGESSEAGGPILPLGPPSLATHLRYEEARGAPFEDEELTVARASLVYTMGYTARCEHSDAALGPAAPPSRGDPPPGTARAFLAAHAAELLEL